MNRLIMTDSVHHIRDWCEIIKFWHVLFPGARSEATTTKPRKTIK